MCLIIYVRLLSYVAKVFLRVGKFKSNFCLGRGFQADGTTSAEVAWKERVWSVGGWLEAPVGTGGRVEGERERWAGPLRVFRSHSRGQGALKGCESI